MFLHYVLSRDESELLSQVFMAQSNSPVKNDWSEKVKNDLTEFGINMTFEESQEAGNPCAGGHTIDFQVGIRPKSV